ncbi:MAG TPA: hypothetical protein VMZ28_17625 [Kofleriaceae bacterium]|nr:hypothetical protein [Kofleriaceae bacterium]
MRALLIALSLGLTALAACKAEEKKPDPAPAAPAAPSRPFVPPAEVAAVPAAPAAPEPTTPAEIEEARKKAMLEGRDADVIKYCEMAGVTTDSGDGQAALGCALAACRIGDPAHAEKAKAWAKKLPKALKQQANQICMANKVVL